MALTSYLSRFVTVVRDHDGGVFTTPDAEGRHRLVEYCGRRFREPVTLDFTETEFDAALETMGRSAQQLWPDVTREEAAFRLVLVHLQESMATVKGDPSRMYFDVGGLTVQ